MAFTCYAYRTRVIVQNHTENSVQCIRKSVLSFRGNDYKHLLIINPVFHSCTVVCVDHSTTVHSAGNNTTLPLSVSPVRRTNIDVTVVNINAPTDSLIIPIVATFSRRFSFENVSFYLSLWLWRFHPVRYTLTECQL